VWGRPSRPRLNVLPDAGLVPSSGNRIIWRCYARPLPAWRPSARSGGRLLLPVLASGTPALAVCEQISPLETGGNWGWFRRGNRARESHIPGSHIAQVTEGTGSPPKEMSIRAARRTGLYQRDRIPAVYVQELLRFTGEGRQSAVEAESARVLETVCS
jgi:hypothetical protein